MNTTTPERIPAPPAEIAREINAEARRDMERGFPETRRHNTARELPEWLDDDIRAAWRTMMSA